MCFKLYNQNNNVGVKSLSTPYVYIEAWGSFLGLQNGWYNTEIESRKSDMYPLKQQRHVAKTTITITYSKQIRIP